MSNGTKTSKRTPVPVALAELLIFQHSRNLPDPTGVDLSASNEIISLQFDTRDAIDAWQAALEPTYTVRSQIYSHSPEPQTLHNGYGKRWGWSIQMSALTPLIGSSLSGKKIAHVAALGLTAPDVATAILQPDDRSLPSQDPTGVDGAASQPVVWAQFDETPGTPGDVGPQSTTSAELAGEDVES